MTRALNPLDLSWLLLDSADTPMHVSALLIFRMPAKAPAAFVGQLAAQLRATPPLGAPWTSKLQRNRRNPLRAQWIADESIDLDYHVRQSALPAPGGERELGVLVSRLHGNALDLARPAWELHLIEGLHDGGFAVFGKMHHALIDAAGFVRLLTRALSARKTGKVQAPWALDAEPRARERAGEHIAEALRGLFAGQGFAPLREFGGAMLRAMRARLRPDEGLRAPYSAPRSVINTRIGAQRRVATQQYPLERLARAASALEASLDELVLFLCGSVLRRFFKEYNALPDAPFVAALPIAGDGLPDAHGSIDFVSLGTQWADPQRRLDEIKASLQASREHLAALPEHWLPLYTLAVAGPYLAGQALGGARLLPAMFNLIVAIDEGPDAPLYLGGARLQALYPLFPLTQGSALTISVLRYAGTLNVGFTGARETLPGLQRMAVYMGQALDELEERIAEGETP
jgi:diacylglycerol O-acyltransferase